MDYKKFAPRIAYGYDHDKASDETGLECKDVSRTVQSQAKDADINEIVRRFGITGQLPIIDRRPIENVDFCDVTDFHSAMNLIKQAQARFDELPPLVREQFDNDPGAFVDFCSDSKNAAEMQRLGLTNTPPPPEPEKTPENQGDAG